MIAEGENESVDSSMVLCLVTRGDAELGARVQTAAAVEFQVRRVRGVSHIRELATRAWCTLLVESTIGSDTVVLLTRLEALQPRVPTVLVTRREGYDHRVAGEAHVDSIVWAHELETVLGAEVCRVRGVGIRELIRRAANRDPRLSTVARRAIHAATASANPFATVAALAASIGRARSTLWRAWNDLHPTNGLRVEDLLDWLLLIEAISRKRHGKPWSVVAFQLGVHEHTLGRIAERLAGIGLRELSAHGQALLSDATVRATLARFLGRQSIDDLV